MIPTASAAPSALPSTAMSRLSIDTCRKRASRLTPSAVDGIFILALQTADEQQRRDVAARDEQHQRRGARAAAGCVRRRD